MRETHKSNADGWIPGDYWEVCDVCGLDYRHSEMKTRWDNARVCPKDFEPRNQQESVRGISEKIGVRPARPVPSGNNLITEWGESSTYETFASTDADITSAINSAGNGSARTNDTQMVSGTRYTITAILELNSGQYPSLTTGSQSAADGDLLGQLSESNGVNTINFTAAAKSYIYLTNTADSNFECTFNLTKIITQDDL